MYWISFPMLLLGLILTVACVVGLWRLPDVYLRYKAVAVVGGLAAVLIHISTALMVPFEFGARGFLTAFLFLLSGPLVGQAILSAAHGLKAERTHKVDELTEAISRAERPNWEG